MSGAESSIEKTARAAEEKLEKTEEALEDVARSPWTERLARFGYASKGAVYVTVGVLASLAAAGLGGNLTDTRGAMRTIELQPFGKVVLVLIAAGLGAYSLWRVVQAVADADRKGREPKGLAVRTGYLCSGLVYAGLAFSAVRILFDASGESRGNSLREWAAFVLSLPFGYLVIDLAGLSVVGFGLYQIYKGLKAKFRKRLKVGELGARDGWAVWSGRLGYPARGVVFCVIGAYLLRAAFYFNPNEAKGLDGALQALPAQGFGTLPLAVVAVGLVAYGLFAFVEARYRRIAGS